MKSFTSLVLALSFLLAACDDEPEENQEPCVAETTQPCACGMELGVQVCTAGQWQACVCDEPDAAECQPLEVEACSCGGLSGSRECGPSSTWGFCHCEGSDTSEVYDEPDTSDVYEGPYTGPRLDYRYVRVDDLSWGITGQDAGADIDAVILEKASGYDAYADKIEAFQLGVNVGDFIDPNNALGAPDSVVNYTDPHPTCDVTQGFVSLGGSGYLVLRMSDVIEVGDYIAVIEVGGCDYGGGTAWLEEVKVQVSVAAEPENLYWVTLGSGEGPYLVLSVTSLPVVIP